MCYVCGEEKDVKNISLYVNGFEGTNLCRRCRIMLVNLIRGMARIGAVSKKKGFQLANKTHKTL